jgi:hypothetical protein
MPEAYWIDPDDPRPQPPTAPERAAQFLLDRFVEVLTLEGGHELENRCVGEEIPALIDEVRDPGPLAPLTQACGGQTRFELPYEKEDGSTGFIRACASCDLAIRWPRLTPEVLS